MATPTQPSFIPEPWAETSGNFDTIPATQQETGRASWENGFPLENTIPVAEGGTPSHYLDFQGVLNALSTFAWWQQRGGQFTWSADLEYPVGAFVLGSDGNLYKSIQASSPSDPQDPTTATAYWTIADPTAFLPLTGGTITGNLYLSGGKNVEAVDSSSFSADTGYIRYTSGLQLCWGKFDVSGKTGTVDVTVTYPKAFSVAPSIVFSGHWASGGNPEYAYTINNSPTSPTLRIVNCSSNDHSWRYIAVGTWS